MNSPQNKIFVFLKYWPIPFGVLQTCCEIQKCKKIIFVVFKKSMRKHIFKTSNIFFKERSKHVKVLAVCNTQKQFLYFSLLKTETLLSITIKVKKPRISQILKTLINQLLNPKKYIETCSYIFTENTT